MSVYIFRKNSFLFFLFIGMLVCNAQYSITGVVLDQNSNPITEASIQVLELKNKGTVSDFDGKFKIETPSGVYTLKTSFIGFKDHIKKIEVDDSKTTFITIVLQEDIKQLSDVIVKGKSKAQKTREKAFEVEVIETKELKNVSADINAILTTIPGVNIRQKGGLGSDFEFSMNGLSGKQIKFFMDGIPLENFGSSLSLNNFPATLIDRVEVFKGVVPIYLGADALGGAVNIITNQRRNDFLDISYDVGSFNTHRATVNGQYYSKKGFTVQLSSFYNYSDNDYEIDDIEVRDALGNDTGVRLNNVRRFHDAYNSQMITVKAGVVDQSFADRLLVGITTSANKNEIQHPIDPQNPFGEVFTKNDVINASIIFEKANMLKERLKVKLYASIGQNNDKVVDTSARKYDWFGGFEERVDQSLGEFEFNKSLFEFKDDTHIINAFVNYKLSDYSTLNFNYTKNYIKRTGKDPAKKIRVAFQDPHILDKNILGLSYDMSLLDTKWNTTLFVKGFYLNSEAIIEDEFVNEETERFTKTNNTLEELGYGFASTYKFSDYFQIKGSFERTFRIPEGYEVFGDGLLLKSNPELSPEKSYNANLGFLLKATIHKFKLSFDSNIFLRESENFIAIKSQGIFSRFFNTADARSTGAEGEIKAIYNDALFVSLNATYQNIIDRGVGKSTGSNSLQNQRIANIPYLFGNASIGYNLKDLFSIEDQLSISWSSYYVHEYPLDSYVEGNPEDRFKILEQFSHNAQLGYSFKKGTYNISLQARNILDAKVYDNFDIQQPGRAFYVKLRYYLTN
ncbi:TonB-dependent receptor [Aquimarina longa]|uniref:TonB-dependent receptor n=1 Tax=Aquimarina longa TaxID=1080221 RepID=UPI0009E9AE9D|nr:TonB-dependent receptor [Aquimarina longa]